MDKGINGIITVDLYNTMNISSKLQWTSGKVKFFIIRANKINIG